MKTILLKRDKNYLLKAKAIYAPKDLAESLQYKLTLNPSSDAEPEIVELSDFYVLPAFCDCHTHIALSGYDFNEHLSLWHDRRQLLKIYRTNLARNFKAGVLTIREGGDPNDLLLKFIQDNPKLPVTILTPGYGMSRIGFYGGFITHQSSAVAEMLPQIRALKAAGASHCKIFLSGLVNFKVYGQVGKIQFTQAELNLLVKTAQDLALPVMVHANSPEAIAMAIEAGVNSIEHGFYVTYDQLLAMAAKNIAWVPTVVPVAKQQQAFPITEKIVTEQLEKVRFAVHNGVPVGIGTDAGAGGVLHGSGYHDELALFSNAGLSRQELLTAACVISPKICALQNLKFLLYLRDPLSPHTDLKGFVGTILPE